MPAYIALLALICAGCAVEAKWRYEPTPPIQHPAILNNSVTVSTLSDERPPEPSEKGSTLLMFLPGVLYQTICSERTEQIADTNLKYRPSEDVAHAVADEVNNRRIFRSVVFSQNATDGELLLRGRLTSTQVRITQYQYGIAVLAAYLWLLGLPPFKINLTLEFELQLNEPMTQTLLWEKTYKQEREFFEGFYYGAKRGDLQFDSMLKELMPQMLADLEQAIKGLTMTAAAESPRGQISE